MLTEKIAQETEVHVENCSDMQNFLESDFKTSYLDTTLDRIEITPDGFVDAEGQRFQYTQFFLERAVKEIELGLKFAYDNPFELFKYNFDKVKKSKTKAVKLCINRGCVVNIADHDYEQVPTQEILDSLDGVDQKIWNFQQARISDRGVEVNFIIPEKTANPHPGDTIHIGFRLSNSETGWMKGPKASLFTLRLICTNGAVMTNKMGNVVWDYNRRVLRSTRLKRFQIGVEKLQGSVEKVQRVYEGVAGRLIYDRDFARIWRRVHQAVKPEKPEETDLLLGVDSEERQKVQRIVRERQLLAEPVLTQWMIYDLHNRITQAAQSRRFSIRNRLEEIGGGLLSLN